jgi:hypothetical protein
MRRALCLALGWLCAAAAAAAGDEIYYRKDESGALVLTNVPDHHDLRSVPGRGRMRGVHTGEEFRELIFRTALRHGVHPDLVYAMAAVESNFDPRAVSSKGALGLMQLMPDTAARFGVADPFNPAENVLGGVRYMRYLLDLFGGDARLALAAYNAGENVVLAGRGIPPYRETRGYVGKVMRLFGGLSKSPYVSPPRRPVAGGAGVESPIYTYIDEAGVVHYSDQPPAAPQRPAAGAASGAP